MIQATYGAALAAAAAGRFQRSAVTSSSTACSSQRRDVTLRWLLDPRATRGSHCIFVSGFLSNCV